MLESTRTDSIASHRNPGDHALLSAFVPGLGQLVEGRFVAAAVQFGTVMTYVLCSFAIGARRTLLVALVWNLWSVVDAYRHDSD